MLHLDAHRSMKLSQTLYSAGLITVFQLQGARTYSLCHPSPQGMTSLLGAGTAPPGAWLGEPHC